MSDAEPAHRLPSVTGSRCARLRPSLGWDGPLQATGAFLPESILEYDPGISLEPRQLRPLHLTTPVHRLHRKALGKLSGAALVVDGLLTRIFDSMAGNASPPKARNTLTHQAYPWIFSAGVIATAVAALGGAIGIATALRTSGSHAVILATNTFVPGAFDVAVGRRDIATIDQPIVIPPGAR